MESLQPTQPAPNMRGPAHPAATILWVGLVAEVLLPWIAVGISDAFFFDIPAWGVWALFGGPPAVTLLALLVHWAASACARQIATGWQPQGMTYWCR